MARREQEKKEEGGKTFYESVLNVFEAQVSSISPNFEQTAISKQLPGFIRTLQQIPFKVVCASYDQLKVGSTYFNKSKKSIIHMDSSGKFLSQKGKKKKPLLNTAIVIPPPAPGHAPFPILEMISESNKTIDYKIFLETGLSLLSKAIGNEVVANPSIAVTDLSFPNIHSLLSVFNQVKLKDYIERCYEAIMSKSPIPFKTAVSFCTNHLIPLLLKSARSSGSDKVVSDTTVAAFMLVLEANTFEEALVIWRHVVIAHCSKEVSEEVEKSRKFIEERSKGDSLKNDDISIYNYDFEDDTDKEEENEYGNRKLLRANSPFYKLFKRSVDKRREDQENISSVTNRFYAPNCINVLLKQYLSLFPLLSASVLDGNLITNTHVELYWKDQRRIIKDIPDRVRWPPRYFGAVLANVRREAKNFLLHNIVPTLKFGGKEKTGDDINFSDYIDGEREKIKSKNVFKPTKLKSERSKRKANESLYGSEEQWESQQKKKPRTTKYIKDKEIHYDAIVEEMDPPIESIRVTGAKNTLGFPVNYAGSVPNAIVLTAEDIRYIQTKHTYITTDAVDAGLCLLDRKLNEESSLDVAVYSSQNCRLIFNGEKSFVKKGKFVSIVPRNFGLNEEGHRYADLKKGGQGSEPGSHFTMISNLFCESNEVNVYETFSPFRNDENLLTQNCKTLLKSLCNSESSNLKVNCINVAEQSESECGALAVALAVHLCFYHPSENAIYKRLQNVRQNFLECLKQNSLTYFKMTKRALDIDEQIVCSIKI